jgi:hypothetical protein
MEHRSRKTWQDCNKCNRKTRSLRTDEDGFVCFNCYRKGLKVTLIPDPINSTAKRPSFSLDKALEKEYTVVSAGNGWHTMFPQVLAGYKFKIKLIKEEDDIL